MSATADLLNSLGSRALTESELQRFLDLLATAPDKDSKQASLNHLLLVVDLTPEQAAMLARNEVIRQSIGLQHSLKRYASSKLFEAERTKAENESGWKKAADFIAGAATLFPF